MSDPLDAVPHRRHLRKRFRGKVETHDNLNELGSGVAGVRKRIIICADGTWNAPKKKDATATNVWLTYGLIKNVGADGLPQLKYYHAGVGTAGDWLARVFEGATGGGLEWNMLDCYRFLVEHYRPGDAVYLFGFSRGAYTVRTLAGLIRNSGIIDVNKVSHARVKRTIDEAYSLYRNRSMDATPVAPQAVEFRDDCSHPDFRIAGIGVWDTVGSLGIPAEKHSPMSLWNMWRYSFHDVSLSAYVDCALHALAIDERRGPFRSTLWIQQPHAKAEGQVLEQTWFPGAHSDVGGGNPWAKRGLATASLKWLVARMEQYCALDFDRTRLDAIVKRTHEAYVISDSMTGIYRAMNVVRLTRPFQRVIDSSLAFKGARDFDRLTTEALIDEIPAPKYETPGYAWPPANVTNYQKRLNELNARDPKQSAPPFGLDRKPLARPPA